MYCAEVKVEPGVVSNVTHGKTESEVATGIMSSQHEPLEVALHGEVTRSHNVSLASDNRRFTYHYLPQNAAKHRLSVSKFRQCLEEL